MRLCLFLIALLISSNSKANDKVRCDTLTDSPYDFYGKGALLRNSESTKNRSQNTE